MDQSLLVSRGHSLIKALDEDGFRPRVAMWVYNSDADSWRLWIVPPEGFADMRAFYRRITDIVANNKEILSDIDASDTEMVLESHPAMKGIGEYLKMPGLGSSYFSGNKFGNFYLPEGIILRSNL
jgi:hypothetical protein